MGAAASSGGIDRYTVYQETTTTREVINTAFNYMIKELNIKDFYKLSNPTECGKYVLFLANKIDESFYKLDLVPSFKDGGRVFFRPIKQLQEPTDVEKTERQSLCVFLSYFFIRFFQIYGALAMTLIDDMAVVSKSGILTDMPSNPNQYGAPSRSLGTPGYEGKKGIYPYQERSDRSTDWRHSTFRNYNNTRRRFLFGGGAAAAVQLPPTFKFLTKYLLPTAVREGSMTVGYPLHSGNLAPTKLFFKPPGTSIFGSPAVGFLYAPFKNHPGRIFELHIMGLPGNKIRFTGAAFRRPTGDKSNKDIKQEELQRMLGTADDFQFEQQGTTNDFRITINGQQLTPYIFLRNIMNHIMTITAEVLKDERGETVRTRDPERDLFRPIQSSEQYRSPFSSGSERYRGMDSSFQDSDKSAPVALKMGITLETLGKIKPIPSCVGRAIQLLKTKPLDPTGIIESDICSSKFLVGEDSRLGTTRPGEKLDDIPGLASLLQLFYEFVQYKNPTILLDLKNTLEPYKQFMLRLAERYELTDDADAAEAQRIEQETFQKIEKSVNPDAIKRMTRLQLEMKDRRMEKLCTTLKEKDGKVVVEANVATDVRESVMALLRTQLLHAANCAKILNQLFLIHGKGMGMTVEIHPNIFKKGMPELDKLNDAVRQLLVTYYETCEKQYMEGVQKIVAAKRTRNATRKQRNEVEEQEEGVPPIAPVPARPTPAIAAKVAARPVIPAKVTARPAIVVPPKPAGVVRI